MHVHMFACTYVSMQLYVNLYVCTYIYIHTCIHIYVACSYIRDVM